MNDIKISIIIPVLNGMPYLKKALDSIINQTIKELEVLVVDSGSSDGTREYVLETIKADNRVRLLSTEKKSMGHQYNLGIKNASGLYIGFCESDDYIESNAYKRLYEEAVRHQYPEIVKADFYMFINKEEKENTFYYSILPKKFEKLYGKEISIQQASILFLRDVNMWNGIYKKSFLTEKKILLNETNGAAFQDTSFGLQVNMTADRIVYIQTAFYHYRKDNCNSSIYRKKTYRFAIWELMYMLDWFEKNTWYGLLYSADVLQRIFNFFVELYGEHIYWNSKVSQDREVELLRKRLKTLYDQQDYAVLAEMEQIELLWLFIESAEAFEEAAKRKTEKRMRDLARFWNYVADKKNLIIFGCGEYGQNLLALLLKNDYNGEVCFCDNDKIKQHTKISSYEVWSVEESFENIPNGSFLIPSRGFYREMKIQLLKMGVKPDKIIQVQEVPLHAATETDIMKKVYCNI